MILFFSGTGNSEYTAGRIGKVLGDDVISLFEKIRSRDTSEMHSASPWVVVAPTYAWRIPRIVREWLVNTSLAGNQDIYFVMGRVDCLNVKCPRPFSEICQFLLLLENL